ncbi:hypothetical protein NKI79_28280 [Mesorhizobium sp. M0340]|uniref:hypothetical protein n=1 Tax=Mesorhizobium sp. M0340 TaxID=2956939 RepID=UPI00333CF7FF
MIVMESRFSKPHFKMDTVSIDGLFTAGASRRDFLLAGLAVSVIAEMRVDPSALVIGS